MQISKILQKEIDPVFARRGKIILENLDTTPGARILEVGCGRGFYINAINQLLPSAQITGIDISEKYLKKAQQSLIESQPPRQNIKLLKADATSLPFADQTFNQVICSEVLEHIKKDAQVIAEIYRVLNLGGSAIFTVPHKNYPFAWDPLNFVLERVSSYHVPSHIWWLAGIWADHQRLYTQKELTRNLKKSGFSISRIWRSTRYALPFSHFLLYGLGKNLVELGILDKRFNRFDLKSQVSLLNGILGLPFRLMDKLNNGAPSNKRFVNLIVKVTKK